MTENKDAGLKKLVFKLDKGICHICGERVNYFDAVLDHIIPKVNLGNGVTSDEYWNLRISHKSCNSKRSNAKIPGQIRLNIKEVYEMIQCPECKSENLTKSGKTWVAREKVQRWRCKNCGRIFTEKPPEIKRK